MPRVSIIVPNYNYAGFIGLTLESVLQQTYTDWELLVVDDNSTDESREVVREYIRRFPERHISLIHHEQGPSGTPTPVNIGIQHMRGEFFAWLSSDDLFEPAKLEEQVKAFDRRPELGLVHTAFQAIDENGAVTGSFFPADEFEEDAFTALLDGNFINGNTVLIRKAVLDRIGPFIQADRDIPELWRAAEYYAWLQIASQYPVHCIQEVLHQSRRHSGNADYNGSAKGPALERVLIRRFLENYNVPVSAATIVALCGRGLWREAFDTLQYLAPPEKTRALAALQGLEENQERWDIGQYDEVYRLDNNRIRSAFRAGNTAQARAMLEAVTRLDSPQTKPYRAAAARKLACLA